MRVFQIFLFLLALMPVSVFAGNGHIAVVELFTSQGCTDAHKAEQVFQNLAKVRHQNLILVSCHVTYFNDENFQDYFAKDICDQRFKKYKSISGVYENYGVPHAIVNGRFANDGAKENLIRSSIELAHSMDDVVPIQVGVRDKMLDITFPKIRAEGDLEVWLFAYDKKETAFISTFLGPKTEITHINAAKHIHELTGWDGGYATTSIPLIGIQADGYAVIAQYRGKNEVIAAGKFEKR